MEENDKDATIEILKLEIGNLKLEIENLKTEIDKLFTEKEVSQAVDGAIEGCKGMVRMFKDIDEEEHTYVSEEHTYVSEEHCLWCKGFTNGIDANWDWVRVALFKVIHIQNFKTMTTQEIFSELYKSVESISVEEFEEIMEDYEDIITPEDPETIYRLYKGPKIKSESEEEFLKAIKVEINNQESEVIKVAKKEPEEKVEEETEEEMEEEDEEESEEEE